MEHRGSAGWGLALSIGLLLLPVTGKGGEAPRWKEKQEVAVVDFAARSLLHLYHLPRGGPYPDISADGKKVLFGSSEGDRQWLYLADITAGRLSRISPHAAGLHLHNISDDGKSILFVQDAITIWSVEVETGSSRRVWEAPPGRILKSAVGSRDGRRILIEDMDEKSRGGVELRLLEIPDEIGG
jgi:dipeptidyl aminopeptidase/acylaminoacyl peptidase